MHVHATVENVQRLTVWC